VGLGRDTEKGRRKEQTPTWNGTLFTVLKEPPPYRNAPTGSRRKVLII